MCMLDDIISRIGDFTSDSILITKAEPVSLPGPEIVWCNRGFTAMTGYRLDEVVGRSPRFLQGSDTDPAALRAIGEGLRQWRNVRAEVKNYTKAGEAFWSEIDITPVADAEGWYRYWVSVQRDVTQRKESELAIQERLKALSATKERLERERLEIEGVAAVAKHAQDLITITDPGLRILWANRAFCARTGYAKEDVLGRLHCDLLDKRGAVYSSRELAVKAIISGAAAHDEVRNTALSGEHFWTDLVVTPLRDERGAVERFILVERETTEQVKLREDLANALKAQCEVNEQQIQFVRTASHELRTPITVISMAVRRIRKQIDKDTTEGVASRLGTIEDALARLDSLVESTLSLGKADAGKLSFSPATLNLGAYLEEYLEKHRDHPTHRIMFTNASPSTVSAFADTDMLDHVLDNLISNAIKYSPAAEKIELTLSKREHYAAIEVRDFGIGVSTEELKKLGTRYFRASTATGFAGTGIGLSVVKEVLKLHRGHLEIESAEGDGSRFTAVLPARPEAATPAEARRREVMA